MGLLSLLFGKSKDDSSSSTTKQREHENAKNQVERDIPLLTFDGNDDRRVFVYDAYALPSLSDGESFRADVIPHGVTMISRHTGYEVSTEGMSTALAYNGRVFGSTSTALEVLTDIAASGYHVTVEVRKNGMYDSDIPQLESLTADISEIKRWWKTCKMFNEIIPFDEIDRRVMTASFKSSLPVLKEGNTTVSLDLIPWKSERAKNPMTISMKVDGVEVLQAKANTVMREKLTPFASKTSEKAMIERYSDSGKWKITALFD